MDAGRLWELFFLTGQPMAYALYRSIEDEIDNEMS